MWYANSEGRYGETGRKGDLGQAIVGQYCADNGIPWVPKEDIYSKTVLKIDCIIDHKMVDVKANVKNNQHKIEVDGWLLSTSAEFIYPVDLINKRIYSYSTKEMREYVKNNRLYSFMYRGARLTIINIKHPLIERLL